MLCVSVRIPVRLTLRRWPWWLLAIQLPLLAGVGLLFGVLLVPALLGVLLVKSMEFLEGADQFLDLPD